MNKAVAYYRTSSASGVGADKDSEKRQKESVCFYADRSGIEIVGEFYDAAVSGMDNVLSRPEFKNMIKFAEENGIKTVLIETASRFARDVMVQFPGYDLLKKMGISLVPVDSPTYFTEDNPSALLIRTVLAGVSRFEKDMFVERSKKARDRIRKEKGRCEGRKPPPQEVTDFAMALRSSGMTIRAIAAELDRAGHRVMVWDGVGESRRRVMSNKKYGAGSVNAMLGYRYKKGERDAKSA